MSIPEPGGRVQRHFEEDIRNIKHQVLEMAGAIEAMITDATRSLVQRDAEAPGRVVAREHVVNRLQNTIDEACLRFFALHQPMAGDLRFLASVLKMTADLERIGDLTVNIVQGAQRLMNDPPLKPYVDLPRMASLAAAMVHKGLDALVKQDEQMAREVLLADNEVDALKDQMLRELLTFMMEDPQKIPICLQLIFVSKHYERIADHATNIAEEVIYYVSGRDIRHHQEELDNGQAPGPPAGDAT
jgi:phosphate transport system protein